MNPKPPIWTDDAGAYHVASNMYDLPAELQAGITRMVTRIARNPAARLNGKQTTHGQREQVRAWATEAVNILLCVLLTHLPQDEIDRRPYGNKRRFVVRWCGHQRIPFVVAA